MFYLGESYLADGYDDPRTIQINEEFPASYHVGLIARNLSGDECLVDSGTTKLVRLGIDNLKLQHLSDPDHPCSQHRIRASLIYCMSSMSDQ